MLLIDTWDFWDFEDLYVWGLDAVFYLSSKWIEFLLYFLFIIALLIKAFDWVSERLEDKDCFDVIDFIETFDFFCFFVE